MTFNFLPKKNLERLTFEEVNKLVKNNKAELSFTKIRNSRFGVKTFLLYKNNIYYLDIENEKNDYKRIHKKEYFGMLKEARDGK